MNVRNLLLIGSVLLVGGFSLALQFGAHSVPSGGFFCDGRVNTYGMPYIEVYKRPCALDALRLSGERALEEQLEVLRRAMKEWSNN